MRLTMGGCVWILVMSIGATAMGQDDSNGVLPPLRRPVMEVGYFNEPEPVDSFWQEGPPPVPNPIPDMSPNGDVVPGAPIAPYGGGGYAAYGIPVPRYIPNAGDGYYPYAPVAYNACCAYESPCGDPTEYKLKVWTICDLGHELWNEVLFGVIDPSCRFDPDCSQGPPTCCRKHGVGLLDFFPEHRDRLLAHRAQACRGCSTSDTMYHNANPPGHNHYHYGQDGYAAARPNYGEPSKAHVVDIQSGQNSQRTAREVFTVPTQMKIR